jgi:hypothetical protein
MRRFQARRTNGRFVRNTLANTLGLQPGVCRGEGDDWCGGLNPHRVGEPPPEKCGHCGRPLERGTGGGR